MKEKREKEKPKKDQIKCSNCGSGFGYIQIKTGNWVCRSCGNIEKVKKEVKN